GGRAPAAGAGRAELFGVSRRRRPLSGSDPRDAGRPGPARGPGGRRCGGRGPGGGRAGAPADRARGAALNQGAGPAAAVPDPPRKSLGAWALDVLLWGGVALVLVISFGPVDMDRLPRLFQHTENIRV